MVPNKSSARSLLTSMVLPFSARVLPWILFRSQVSFGKALGWLLARNLGIRDTRNHTSEIRNLVYMEAKKSHPRHKSQFWKAFGMASGSHLAIKNTRKQTPQIRNLEYMVDKEPHPSDQNHRAHNLPQTDQLPKRWAAVSPRQGAFN